MNHLRQNYIPILCDLFLKDNSQNWELPVEMQIYNWDEKHTRTNKPMLLKILTLIL